MICGIESRKNIGTQINTGEHGLAIFSPSAKKNIQIYENIVALLK